MEKRLLLSLILSFVVLYVWFGHISPPSPNQLLENSQLIENEEVMDEIKEPLSPTPFTETIVAAKDVVAEEVSDEFEIVLESNNLIATFSSLGGNLIGVKIKEYDVTLPVTNIVALSGFLNKPFDIDKETDTTIVFSHDAGDFIITKTYELSRDGYDLFATVGILNNTQASKQLDVSIQSIGIDMSRLDDYKQKSNGNFNRDRALFEYAVSSSKEVYRKNNAYKFASKEGKEKEEAVNWVAFRDRYYSNIVKPLYENTGFKMKVLSEEAFGVDVSVKNVAIKAGEEKLFSSLVYIGPEKTTILKEYDKGLAEVKRFYRFGLFDFIAKIIYGVMHFLSKIIPNWGVVIVVMSVLIYFSTYPLTLRGMSSMKKMQTLQPKMQALKEKHKDNPQKLNKEMMELYKTEKINPMGGCLPFLLQMPIFIGLYQVLWRDVSLKGADFLWIKDLASPDRLFIMPFSVPFLGNEFNLLPLLMVIIMAVQQRISAKNMMSTDPQQVAQQKMMARIMPIFIGVIFYKFASGLSLYFTLFYLFSTITQFKISKEPKVT